MSTSAGLKRSLRIAGALIISLMALAACTTTAQAGWSNGATISGSGPLAQSATIAGLPDGRSVAVWLKPVGGMGVYASRIDADGNAGAAVRVSTSPSVATSPVVKLLPNGDAFISWVRQDGINDVVQSNTFSAAGVAGTVVDRSNVGPALADADRPRLAVAADGSVGMTWRKYNGTNWTVQSVVISTAGVAGTVQTYQPLATDSGFPDIAANPKVATNASTAFEVAWAVGSLGNANVAFVPLTANGTPGSVDLVSITCSKVAATDPFVCVPKPLVLNPDSVSVGFTEAGIATIVWRMYANRAAIGAPPDFHMSALSTQVVANPSNNTATQPVIPLFVGSAPIFVSPTTDVVTQLDVTQSPTTALNSSFAATWTSDVPGARNIKVAKLGNPATFWQTSPVFSGDIGPLFGSPRISMLDGGAKTVTWTQESALPGVPQAKVMRFTPEGLFQGPATLSQAGATASSGPVPAMSTNGVSTSAYALTDSGANQVIAVSRFTDPAISVSPSLIAFGEDLLNVESAARSIFIFNPGTTSNEVTSVTLGGADASQFVTPDAACVKDIGPGASCLADVEFKPTSAGLKTATVTIQSESGNRVVNIQGTGVARTRVSLKVTPAKQALRAGKSVKVRVEVKNTGGITANNLKVCATGNKKVVRPKKRCVSVSTLNVAGIRVLAFRVKLNSKAKAGRKYPVRYKLTVGNANTRVKYINYALKGKKK